MTSFPDLDYTEDEETDAAGSLTEKRVPPPKQLTLETHLNKSLVIGWNPPENFPAQKIDCFRVVVDGRDSKRQRRRRGHRRRPENVLEPSREVPAAERERRFRGFEAASSDASGR